MFTTQEGEGWQQLGEGLLPNSAKDAGAMIEGFQQMGEKALHSVFSGSSLPDLHDALGAMYNPPMADAHAAAASQQLPSMEIFDSSAAGSQPASGIEISSSAGVDGVAGPSGIEAAGANGGTVETLQSPGLDAAANAPLGDGAFAEVDATSFSDASASLGDSTNSLGDARLGQTVGSDPTGMTDKMPMGDIGKAVTEIFSKMGDMLGALSHGPMGLLGSLLNFLLTIFSEIISSIAHILEEAARAAAALAAEILKKQLASSQL